MALSPCPAGDQGKAQEVAGVLGQTSQALLSPWQVPVTFWASVSHPKREHCTESSPRLLPPTLAGCSPGAERRLGALVLVRTVLQSRDTEQGRSSLGPRHPGLLSTPGPCRGHTGAPK